VFSLAVTLCACIREVRGSNLGRFTPRLPFHKSQSPHHSLSISLDAIRGCIQKFPDWPPGARTANGTALCHYVQLYRYSVSQSSEFCCHNPLCCFSTVFIVVNIYFVFNFWLHPRITSVVETESLPISNLHAVVTRDPTGLEYVE
jgi:hypothetical protein